MIKNKLSIKVILQFVCVCMCKRWRQGRPKRCATAWGANRQKGKRTLINNFRFYRGVFYLFYNQAEIIWCLCGSVEQQAFFAFKGSNFHTQLLYSSYLGKIQIRVTQDAFFDRNPFKLKVQITSHKTGKGPPPIPLCHNDCRFPVQC